MNEDRRPTWPIRATRVSKSKPPAKPYRAHEWETKTSDQYPDWTEADCSVCGASITYPKHVGDPCKGARVVGVSADCDEGVVKAVLES